MELYGNLPEGRTDVIDKIVESNGASSWGINGSAKTDKINIFNSPIFSVANHNFDNVIISTTNGNHSLLGSKILEYGKVTLDYGKKKFYFQLNRDSDSKDLSERNWGILFTVKDQKFVVGTILDKSLENQINLGDEILSFDGNRYTSLTFCEMINAKRNSNKPKVIVELKDINTGNIKKVEIRRI